jgi:hypothetical protein
LARGDIGGGGGCRSESPLRGGAVGSPTTESSWKGRRLGTTQKPLLGHDSAALHTSFQRGNHAAARDPHHDTCSNALRRRGRNFRRRPGSGNPRGGISPSIRVKSLEHLLGRHPGRRGATTVRTCLRRLGGGPQGRVRSRLESRFAALLARGDLPKPQLNAILDLDGFKIEADCLWSAQRVIVELDGGKAHGTRVAFETDRERDRRLQAAGWRVIRVTWRQLDNPTTLLADLRHLLLIESASTVA